MINSSPRHPLGRLMYYLIHLFTYSYIYGVGLSVDLGSDLALACLLGTEGTVLINIGCLTLVALKLSCQILLASSYIKRASRY